MKHGGSICITVRISQVAFSFVFMWGEWECNMETKKERDQEGVHAVTKEG